MQKPTASIIYYEHKSSGFLRAVSISPWSLQQCIQ